VSRCLGLFWFSVRASGVIDAVATRVVLVAAGVCRGRTSHQLEVLSLSSLGQG
jgi:hypothetical protein